MTSNNKSERKYFMWMIFLLSSHLSKAFMSSPIGGCIPSGRSPTQRASTASAKGICRDQHVHDQFYFRPYSRNRGSSIKMYGATIAPTNDLRLRNIGKNQHNGKGIRKIDTSKAKIPPGPPNFKRIESREEFDNTISFGIHDYKMVVVRFYATWCKSCRAMQPLFRRLVYRHSDILFVEVAVSDRTKFVIDDLGVEKLPSGHIYVPGIGLAERMSISKKNFPDLVAAMKYHYTSPVTLS